MAGPDIPLCLPPPRRRVKHSDFSKQIEEACLDPANKAKVKLKAESVDVAYAPVVQSGGKFDAKMMVPSDDRKIHPRCVAVSVGTRYNSYCSNCARTFLINAPKKAEAQYAAVLKALEAMRMALTDGARLADVHAAAVASLRADPEHAALADLLPKTLGSVTGLEFRDSAFAVGPKSDAVARKGMTFWLNLVVTPLEDADEADAAAREYCLQVSDTFLVKEAGTPAEFLTDFAKRTWGSLTYNLDIEMPQDGMEGDDGDDYSGPAIGKENLRELGEDNVGKRQRELAALKSAETMDRLLAAKEKVKHGKAENKGRTTKSIVSYKGVEDVPLAGGGLTIQVDHSRESVLLPIYGVLVPFHITCIKTITYSQEGENFHSIRVIFNTPASFGAEGFQPAIDHPDKTYIKELNFRSKNASHASTIVQAAKTLQRTIKSRDKERAERATLVVQEKLVPLRQPRARLPDVWLRPQLGGTGRRLPGVLEVHKNGFRYSSPRTQEVIDVMFGNIKRAFFQPAHGEHLVLVHFHLFDPIMVNKKKTNDVNFYTEVVEMTQTLDGEWTLASLLPRRGGRPRASPPSLGARPRASPPTSPLPGEGLP